MTKNPETCEEFTSLRKYDEFRLRHGKTLSKALGDFLRCRVRLYYKPTALLAKNYHIDITSNHRRTTYPIDATTAAIVVTPELAPTRRVVFAVLLNGSRGAFPKGLLESIARSLRHRLEYGIQANFKLDFQYFGKYLVYDTIVDHLTASAFDRFRVKFALDIFSGLRTLTFEDRQFETGMLFTKSHHEFHRGLRGGKLLPMRDQKAFDAEIQSDRRFWYLADGTSSFYVCSPKMMIDGMFFPQEPGTAGAASSQLVRSTLRGSDFALRTVGGKESVAITGDGDEFTYDGVSWKFRNYTALQKELAAAIPSMKDTFYPALTDLLLSLIARRCSSILWFPESREAAIQRSTTLVRLLKQQLSLSEVDPS